VIGIDIGRNSFHLVGQDKTRGNHAAAEVVTRVTTPMCKNAAVHHSKNCALMSQMGQTRSFGDVCLMSGLPPESGLKSHVVTCPRCAITGREQMQQKMWSKTNYMQPRHRAA
jgi:hypothetical protein